MGLIIVCYAICCGVSLRQPIIRATCKLTSHITIIRFAFFIYPSSAFIGLSKSKWHRSDTNTGNDRLAIDALSQYFIVFLTKDLTFKLPFFLYCFQKQMSIEAISPAKKPTTITYHFSASDLMVLNSIPAQGLHFCFIGLCLFLDPEIFYKHFSLFFWGEFSTGECKAYL